MGLTKMEARSLVKCCAGVPMILVVVAAEAVDTSLACKKFLPVLSTAARRDSAAM